MANSNSYQLLQAMIKSSLQYFICSVTAFGDSLVPFLSFSHSDAKQLCFPPYTFNARGEKRERETNAATVRWAAKTRGELRNVSRRLSESISPYRIEACLLAKLLITARRSAFSVLGSRFSVRALPGDPDALFRRASTRLNLKARVYVQDNGHRRKRRATGSPC